MNYKRLHGPDLVAARYMLVPIKAGAKHPNKKGWPSLRAGLPEIKRWANSRHYGGLGVLGEFNPGIDIDVQDSPLVGQLVAWVQKNIGVTPIRTGRPPRVLIPCAAPPGGLGPDSSAKYEDELGDTHQIEIKAAGQQWVAYGEHPDTKKPYTWDGGELHSVDADLLPELTGEKITALFDYFYSLVPATWLKVSPGRDRQRVGGITPGGELSGLAAFENYKPPLNLDADRIRSVLAVLNPDTGHDLWLKVGMALHHQFSGGDEGLELFRQWSENSVDYDYNEIINRWPSWQSKTYGGSPVTFASIIDLYNKTLESTQDPTRKKNRGCYLIGRGVFA